MEDNMNAVEASMMGKGSERLQRQKNFVFLLGVD